MTFDERVHKTLNTLSENLRVHIALAMESAAKELRAAAEEALADATEQITREARAEAERENTMRLMRLFTAVDDTVAALQREMGMADPARTLDAGSDRGPYRVFQKSP